MRINCINILSISKNVSATTYFVVRGWVRVYRWELHRIAGECNGLLAYWFRLARGTRLRHTGRVGCCETDRAKIRPSHSAARQGGRLLRHIELLNSFRRLTGDVTYRTIFKKTPCIQIVLKLEVNRKTSRTYHKMHTYWNTHRLEYWISFPGSVLWGSRVYTSTASGGVGGTYYCPSSWTIN